MKKKEPVIKKLIPPQATIRRLSIYLRYLNGLDGDGVKVISSHDLARRLALNPAQVRKDLAYFGEFGKRGVGYSVKKLRDHLMKILGLQKMRKVAIIGAGGRLGTALALYTGFERRNFKICALFDKDPEVIGKEVEGVSIITAIDDLPRIVKEKGIEILILTIPAAAIKEIHDIVMLSGVKAVLNFAPYKMLSTEDVAVHNVDLTTELESLSYRLSLSDSVLTRGESTSPVEEE
ncbi:MAG: redox-sensing transcriptional repressor Rex [Candidatus Riflebacteria bacterium HGW-Riflebacteria-2]|jgi:redox-sensing transcriptional repressor|nr:MAG: redox-sensing transcriptional repressor Rex [Candidatus Riflebacteria bacterium HGW-Riflebacteria-2]